MKKIFTSLMMLMFTALSMFAETVTVDLTAQGYENATTVETVTSGDVTLTFDKGTNNNAPKFYTSGNAVRLYGSNSMTVSANGANITAINLTFGTGDGSNEITTNVGSFDTNAWTGNATEVTFSIGGTSGHRRIATVEVTYEENVPAAGWDGTVTTSFTGAVTKIEDLNNLTLTFPGASSVAILDEEDCQYLALQNEDGSELYGIWGPTMGSEYTINGNSITLAGFMAKEGATTAIPAGTTKLYVEDYGTLIIDGVDDYLPTLEFAANIAAAAEPFMLTSVANNDVAGSVVGVEASEQGVSYQFAVTATGKALSKGTATPTLSLMEDASVDFGAAQIVAYGAETAYIRFMTLQQPYFTQPGTYVLDIPEGTFVDAEGTPNAAVTVKWVVIQGEEPSTFAITGATNAQNEPGTEVEALSYSFEITAANAITGLHEGNITLTDAENQPVGGNAYVYGYEGESGANTVYARFTFDTEDHQLHTPGVYTLNVPAGMFKDAEGNLSEAYTASWTVKAQPEVGTFAIESATFAGAEAGAEVEALSYMATINAANAIVALNDGNITLTDANNQPVGGNAYVFGYEGESGANTVYARFTFDSEDHQLHTPGVYTLNVPAGMFKDAEGNLSEAYTASWTVVAPETQTINIETVEVGTVVDDTWGTNDTYYTATVKFAKPEGAVYAYSEGLHMELNGENTGVPFTFGQYNMIQLEEGDEVTLVYKDNMIASTEDAEYEGDIRPAGSYVAETTITFLDENQWEIEGVTAHFVGSIVLPNLNVVELGTPEFNVNAAAEAGVQITEGWVEANGIVMTLADAKNITPDMQINVVADLLVTVPGYGAGNDGLDGGYGMPQFETVKENAEFTGDAMFGVPTVAMPEFAQYVVEAGAGNAFQILVKSIEVVGSTGVEASWTFDPEGDELVGCAFEVVEDAPSTDVVLGDAVINVDGMELSAGDVEANGIYVTFPDAQNVDETTSIKVVADLMTTVPDYGMGGDDVDGGFGVPQFQAVLEDVEFEGSVDIETGSAMVAMPDFAQYVVEAGAGRYMINVKSIVVNDVDVYNCEDETAEPIGAMFAVTETFEVEATAEVSQTEANEWGDRHYQVVVTVENSDNEVSAAGVAHAYTEGVIFYDESTWSEFTFNCEAQEGVEVVQDEDVVLVCTDAVVSQTSDTTFEGELRAEGTYPAYCTVVLLDADFNEVGAARFNGELTLSKDTTTGITSAKFNVTDVTYNMAGQRVNANAKGIVIKNGKKMIQK